MAFHINNITVKQSFTSCYEELERITKIIDGMGRTSNVVPFLTKYSVIKCCGTIEQAFKTIIADYCANSSIPQANNYINETFRDSSINPSLDNIHKYLARFDEQWKDKFKINLDNLNDKIKKTDSLKSLNEARNVFAHGGNPTVSFDNVKDYFKDSHEIITCLEKSII